MSGLLARLKNWKTTIMGSALGTAAAAVIAKLLTDAGCDFSTIAWSSFAAFAFTQIMGALSTDNGKAVSVALVALMLGGCSAKFVHHPLGDDTIQEYIKPASLLEGGFVDRIKCPTKSMKPHPDAKWHGLKVCPGVAGQDAYLSWQTSVDDHTASYVSRMVDTLVQGAAYVPGAAVLGLTMPKPTTNMTVNQTGGAVTQSVPIQTSTTCIGCAKPGGVPQ